MLSDVTEYEVNVTVEGMPRIESGISSVFEFAGHASF